MSIELRVQNMQEVTDALRHFGQEAQAVVSQAVQATALDVRGDIQRQIQRGPKTGRTYLRGSVSHRASAPGEAPATDTGFLASSIAYRSTTAMSAVIESRLDYAYWLEFGTSKIAPRPSWTPAVERGGPRLQERVTSGLEGLL